MQQSQVQQQVREHFGPGVLDDRGAVDRRRLASRVFGAGEAQQAARRQLEQIVHPVIRRDLEQQIEIAARTHDVILLDAAVFLESGWGDACDAIVYVDVPDEARRQRVLATRGWSAEELARREASQWPLERKRAAADVAIDNSDSLARAGQQFLDWYRHWRPAQRRDGAPLHTD